MQHARSPSSRCRRAEPTHHAAIRPAARRRTPRGGPMAFFGQVKEGYDEVRLTTRNKSMSRTRFTKHLSDFSSMLAARQRNRAPAPRRVRDPGARSGALDAAQGADSSVRTAPSQTLAATRSSRATSGARIWPSRRRASIHARQRVVPREALQILGPVLASGASVFS